MNTVIALMFTVNMWLRVPADRDTCVKDPHHQHLRDPMCLGHLGKRPMNMKRDVLT